jgi:hypothetical protein
MNARDLFKLAVRILGLVFLYRGLLSIGVLFPGLAAGASNPITILVVVVWPMIWPLIVAFILLKFAPTITDFFYPKSED